METPDLAKKGVDPVCGFFLTAHAGSFFASRYGINAVRNTHLAGSILLDDLDKFEHINWAITAKLEVTTENSGKVKINRRLFGHVVPRTCTEKVVRRLGDLRNPKKCVRRCTGPQCGSAGYMPRPPRIPIARILPARLACAGAGAQTLPYHQLSCRGP